MGRRAKRIELDVEVAIIPNCLSQRGGANNGGNVIDRSRGCRGSCDGGCGGWRFRSHEGLDLARPHTFEKRASLGIDTGRVLQVALVEVEEIPGVRSLEGAEVAHHQSTLVARKDPSGPAQDRHNTEPATPCALVIMARVSSVTASSDPPWLVCNRSHHSCQVQ